MHSNLPSSAATARRLHASRTPREHQTLAFAWCLRCVRFASRCGGEWSIRPHLCATFEKRCATM
eukprot:3020069-Lingulodinium_polyedra.AAC.1